MYYEATVCIMIKHTQLLFHKERRLKMLELKRLIINENDSEWIKQVHAVTMSNQKAIHESKNVTCGYCLKTYPANEFDDEDDYSGYDAICPYCWIDCILPDALVVLTPDQLQQCHHEWFEGGTDARTSGTHGKSECDEHYLPTSEQIIRAKHIAEIVEEAIQEVNGGQ